jgi:hypothetical protein
MRRGGHRADDVEDGALREASRAPLGELGDTVGNRQERTR